MGRAPCCDKAKVKRGPWSPEEDTALKNYVESHGTGGNWIALPHKAGLKRCGKSCRLRWLNYLRPDIKHGGFTEVEDNIICTLYKSMGSRWSVIASQLPGRTDNDVKNYWNTKLKKKLLAGKTSFTSNNNNISTNNHIQPSFTSSPSLLTKPEFDNYGFSPCFDQNYTTLPLPMEVQNVDSHRMVSNPIHFQSEFVTSASKNHIVSSSQEVSSDLLVPSSFGLEENYFSWSGNGGGEENQFLMGFGFGSSYDLNGFGFHERTSEAAPNLANSDNFFVNTSESKPKELYESVV